MNWYQPWSLRETTADPADRVRRRIAESEPDLRAWVVPPGPGTISGIPMAVKDIIDVEGLPTRCGTALRADAPPATVDAAIVTAWRAAGAVPVGKTVTTEFAYFAPGPTANPAAPGRTPGGSSSGSAAAVAAGHVPLALGTQTAGSVIRPASFCGVAALVLTHGRIPMDGVTGLAPSLDSHGVFAAHVDDLAAAFAMLSGEPAAAVRPPRLLIWPAETSPVDPSMRAALGAARDRWTAAGAVVDDLPAPVDGITAAHVVVMAAEAADERAAEAARPGTLSPQLTELLQRGAAVTAAELRAARATIAEGRERIGELLASYDAVVGPAALGPAPAGLGATGDPALSRPWQALGFPAVAVPGLTDPGGLPLGVQLIGRPSGETALLGTGRWAEAQLH